MNNFPYTNFHEINLDWVLSQVKAIPDTVQREVRKVLEGDISAIVSNITSMAVNVKNPPSPLEAVRDDVDCSAQMQAIVNYCAENGYSVFIPAGRYIFHSVAVPLNRHSISISGCGEASTIDSTGGDCFIFNGGGGVTPCVVSNLYVKNANRAYYFKDLSYIYAVNLYAHGSGVGFDVENVDHSTFISCTSRWCAQYGIDIHSQNLVGYTAPNNIAFYGCRFGNNYGPGVHLYLTSNIVFNACSIEYNRESGIKAEYCGGQGGTQFTASGNYFEGNQGIADIIIINGAIYDVEIEGSAIISNNSFNKVNGSSPLALSCNSTETNKSTMSFIRNNIEYYGTFSSDNIIGIYGFTDPDAYLEIKENRCTNQGAMSRAEFLVKQYINCSVDDGVITTNAAQYFSAEGARVTGFNYGTYLIIVDGVTITTPSVVPGIVGGYPGLFVEFAGSGTFSIVKL